MKPEKREPSELYRVGILLAIVGGYLDVYTYVTRGEVFANAQTGNIVFLGISIATRDWKQMIFYFCPIAAFMLGIVFTELVRKEDSHYPGLQWRQIITVIEIVLLAAISFVPTGKYDDLVNVAVSFVSSMQIESFRKFSGNAYATTMCTGNLRSAMEQFFLYYANRDRAALRKCGQYFGIILFFIVGAIVGMILTGAFRERSVLFVCILLMIVFIIMFMPVSGESGKKDDSR